MNRIPLLICSLFFLSTPLMYGQSDPAPDNPQPGTETDPAAEASSGEAGEKPGEGSDPGTPEVGLADPDAGNLPRLTKELARKGAEAFGKRDWETARAAYAEILEVEPTNALALANLGAVEHQAGNFDKAQTYLEAAVKYNPRLDQSWLVLGIIYYENEQTNLAISALTRALHENPLDPRAHNYLAIVIKSIGWTNGAEAELLRAIELKPDYASAHFNLALMYLDKKPPALELAARHYDKALSFGAKADPIVDKRLGRE